MSCDVIPNKYLQIHADMQEPPRQDSSPRPDDEMIHKWHQQIDLGSVLVWITVWQCPIHRWLLCQRSSRKTTSCQQIPTTYSYFQNCFVDSHFSDFTLFGALFLILTFLASCIRNPVNIATTYGWHLIHGTVAFHCTNVEWSLDLHAVSLLYILVPLKE